MKHTVGKIKSDMLFTSAWFLVFKLAGPDADPLPPGRRGAPQAFAACAGQIPEVGEFPLHLCSQLQAGCNNGLRA